jgi:hypothetical protein
VLDPGARREGTAVPPRCRQEADRERGTGTLELDRVEAARIERSRPLLQLARALVPGSSRVGLVQAQDVPEVLPEPLVGVLLRQLRVDEGGPGARGNGHTAPVRRPLADDAADLLQPRQLVATAQDRVEAGERVRCDDASEPDPRGVPCRELLQALAVPGWDELERVRVGVLDPGTLDVGVEVRDVDEEGPALVGGRGGGAHRLLLPELGGDPENLTGLDVRAVHSELAERLEARVHGRRS